MGSFQDTIKAALEKKKAEQHATNNSTAVDTGKGAGKSQVTQNKPSKKSAGRGR